MEPHIKISAPKAKFAREAVLAACCELASDDKSFLVRKSDDGKFMDVLITLSASGAARGEEGFKETAGEFKAALFEKQLQIQLLKNNMKTCEEIVYNALSNPAVFKQGEPEDALPDSIARIINESAGQEEESYLDDILKIAVPWEDNKQ